MKKLFIYSILFYFISTNSCYAQDFSMTISPPTIKITTLPGEITRGNISIRNNTQENQSFKINVQDFIINNSSGIPEFLEGNSKNTNLSLKKWITIYPNTISILPNQSGSIEYVINTPINGRSGGHYAGILFQPTNTSFVNTAVTTQIASLISVFVPGNIQEYAQLHLHKLNYIQEYSPITINYSISNLGDTDIQPKGQIHIKDVFGKEITAEKIEKINIFPKSAREYTTTTQKYLFGYYRMSINITYGIKDHLNTRRDFDFLVIPWKGILFISVVFTSILMVIFVILKKLIPNKPRMM